MKWPTPAENKSKNAARNKFLGACSVHAHPKAKIMVEIPGKASFQAALLGWDDYTMVLQRENGRVLLVWQAPGLQVAPLHGEFIKQGESKDGQRSDGETENPSSDD